MNCHDRQKDCLLGLAVPDALGAAVEFEMPGSFPEVTGYAANSLGRTGAKAGFRPSGCRGWPGRT